MRTRNRSCGKEAGFSLVEGLIAAGLLLVIAVSVLPLFTRALESNISGGRSSQLSTFAGADLEAVNQGPVDSAAWEIKDTPEGVLTLGCPPASPTCPAGIHVWDIGPLYDSPSSHLLGDEKWIVSTDTPEGPVMWSRTTTVRKYSLADIRIQIGAGGGLVTAGASPFLFDDPLTDDLNAHLAEVRVTVKERRDGLPAASGQRITVGHFRSF